jgi:hypothetical protein
VLRIDALGLELGINPYGLVPVKELLIRALQSFPEGGTLFAARRSDLPSRMINKEVFENELPFAVLKRPAAVRALNLTVGCRRISFDTNQLVLRTTVWTFE